MNEKFRCCKALAGLFVAVAALSATFAVFGRDGGPAAFSAALQREIDAACAAGGGIVRVAPGVHETGPLLLRSGVTLELPEGTVLFGSTNLADYAGRPALVGAEGATNVALVGRGTIDGRGAFFREPKPIAGEAQPTVPMLLRFSRCRGVRLEDVTYRQSGSWGLHLRNCEDVTVRGVRCFNHNNNQNDGIDIESRNVLIENCEIDADDDAICFKTESDPSFAVENVIVRNCRLASTCNFIKFGTGSYGLWRNVLVENCELRRPAAAWRFDWVSRGIPGVTNRLSGLAGVALELADGGRMEDVTIRDIVMTGGVGTPVFVRLERRHEPAEGAETNFRNVRVERVRMTAPAESRIASSITGVPGLDVEGVTLRDCDFLFPGGGTAGEAADRDVPERECAYPEFFMFAKKALPAYGLYLRHARGIGLENVRLRTARPDERPAIVKEEATTKP